MTAYQRNVVIVVVLWAMVVGAMIAGATGHLGFATGLAMWAALFMLMRLLQWWARGSGGTG